ncbi:MAG: PDZ domain-containing protein [Bacteroidota bacterium]
MRYLLLALSFCISWSAFGQWNYNSHSSSNRAFLGVSDRDISYAKAVDLDYDNKYGSQIKYVYEGTAAAAAGLQPFDYLYAIDDKEMTRSRDLSDLLSKYRPGDRVDLRIVRQGTDMTLAATLGRPSDSNNNHRGGSAFLGIREHNNSRDSEIGVKITTVRNSSAIDLGLDDGDVITFINDYPMYDWGDISTMLNNMEKGDPIVIDYLRNDAPQRASGNIGGEDDCDDNENTRGYLGVYTGHMDRDKADELGFDTPYGSYLKRIIRGSGAEAAGLEPLDYVVAINEYELTDDRSLTGALKKYGRGDVVTVTYIRNGQRRTTQATLTDANEDYDTPCAEEPFFGVSTMHSTAADRRRMGVRVNVVNRSAAQASGLRDGDFIYAMDGKRTIDWGDLSAVINGTNVGEQFDLSIVRDRDEMTLQATMGSECDERGESRNENKWYDYNYDESFTDNPSPTALDNNPAVDMDRIQVEMADMDPTEAEDMARRGVDMPLINNLTIENIQLFPNPNRGMFRLEFELPQRGPTSVRVFNSDGRLIYQFDLGEYQGTFSDDIDISQNGAGAYFLEVRQGATSMVKKVILQY